MFEVDIIEHETAMPFNYEFLAIIRLLFLFVLHDLEYKLRYISHIYFEANKLVK